MVTKGKSMGGLKPPKTELGLEGTLDNIVQDRIIVLMREEPIATIKGLHK